MKQNQNFVILLRFHSCSKLLHKDEKLFNTKIEMKFCDNEVHLQEEIAIFYLEKLVFKVMFFHE